MDNKEKFTGKSEGYAKYRPSYPEEFIDYLYGEVGLKQESIVADIGSGTGIFSELLLERGSKVICVEPNDDMRTVSKSVLKDYTQCEFSGGSAEVTLLADKSVDFITVAQAFHWFDKEKFKQECQRILSNYGKVVLVWNSKDSSTEVMQAYKEINNALCPSFKGFSGGSIHEVEEFASFFKEGRYEEREFQNHISFSLEEFIGNALSSSYAPKVGDSNYEVYIDAITTLFKTYSNNDVLEIPYITRSYVGFI